MKEKKKKLIEMWQVRESNGEPINFLTVQEDIARKLCEEKDGRTMEIVMVAI